MVGFVSRKATTICTVVVLWAGVWFRLTAYGDLRLSVATMDTESYARAAQGSILSPAVLTGERLFTTNLAYRIAHAENCPVQALSIPAIGKETNRQFQSCFGGLVLGQAIISIVGWSVLILGFSSLLTKTLSKLVAVAVLTAFAFVPQLADWDSILSAEALTFSLFALALGLMFFTVGRSTRLNSERVSRIIIAGTAATMFGLGLWAFVRDANVYAVILLAVTAAIGAFSRPYRRLFTAVAVSAVCISAIALITAYQSGRWQIPLTDALQEYVLPFPSRVAALQRLGMPAPDSSAYQGWFDKSAPSAYMAFLLMHPRFVASTLADRTSSLFAENNQPYFKTPDLPMRNAALRIGDVVHPKSTVVILLDVVLLAGLLGAAAQTRTPSRIAAAALAGWLLASAALTLALAFFADPIGVERHVVFALVLFRLLMWLTLTWILDLALQGAQPANAG